MTDMKVYYMIHADSLRGLVPFLLIDGERVWHAAKKRTTNGTMYYLFLETTQPNVQYIKLWRDSKGNLLTYIGNITKPIFLAEEPEIFEIDITLAYLEVSDNAMYIGNNYFKFSFPVIGVVRRLNQGATRPLAFLLYQLLIHDTPAVQEPAGSSGGDGINGNPT